MLKFNPQHQLTLAPTPDNKLSASLSISNPSARAAPFKVKSTRPSLFNIDPPAGILLPHQTIRIIITTLLSSSPELVHEVSYHNKFMIEFALVERVPESVNEGIRMINEDNRQEHRLFLGSLGRSEIDNQQARSGISNQYTYRTVNNDDEHRVGVGLMNHQGDSYDGMNSDQKFEYLTREIDRLEKEKSQLIMTSSPKKVLSIFRIVLVIIIGLIVGNLMGRGVGLGRRTERQKREEGWLSKLRLGRFWPAHEQARGEWWQFWK